MYAKLRIRPGAAESAETDGESWAISATLEERRILVNSVKGYAG